MPQLAIETFASQILWSLLGFLVVYLFVSKIFTPQVEEILENRVVYIDDLLKRAENLRTESEKLKEDSFIALENAQIDTEATERKIVASIREQNIKEKQYLYDTFSEKSRIEALELVKVSDNVFADVSKNLDTLVSSAMDSILIKQKDRS